MFSPKLKITLIQLKFISCGTSYLEKLPLIFLLNACTEVLLKPKIFFKQKQCMLNVKKKKENESYL